MLFFPALENHLIERFRWIAVHANDRDVCGFSLGCIV